MRLIVTSVLVLLGLGLAPAQAKLITSCIYGNCTNGIGELVQRDFDEVIHYHGEFDDGRYHGRGILSLQPPQHWDQNGLRTTVENYHYSGIFCKGVFTSGVYWTGSKGLRKRAGCISPNCTNGQGIYFGPLLGAEPVLYRGPFTACKPHGIGTVVLDDGTSKQVEFRDGQPVPKFRETPAIVIVLALVIVLGLVAAAITTWYPPLRGN